MAALSKKINGLGLDKKVEKADWSSGRLFRDDISHTGTKNESAQTSHETPGKRENRGVDFGTQQR